MDINIFLNSFIAFINDFGKNVNLITILNLR